MTKFKFGDKVIYKGEILVVWQSVGKITECLTQNGLIETYSTDFLTKVSDQIPCSERMPEYDSEVIVTNGNYIWNDKCYDFGDGLCFYDDNDSSATHWMPLHDMPEVK